VEEEAEYKKTENITGGIVHQSVSESSREGKSARPACLEENSCPRALSWHRKLERLALCFCCLCTLLFRIEQTVSIGMDLTII